MAQHHMAIVSRVNGSPLFKKIILYIIIQNDIAITFADSDMETQRAIALLGMVNSRLKDYLDLYVLLSKEQIENQVLTKAIQAIFTHRGMPLSEALPISLTDEFANAPSRELLWKAFLRKRAEVINRRVIAAIRNFIQTPAN